MRKSKFKIQLLTKGNISVLALLFLFSFPFIGKSEVIFYSNNELTKATQLIIITEIDGELASRPINNNAVLIDGITDLNNAIKFKLYQSNGLSDVVLFRVLANSTYGFDENLDALKAEGEIRSSSLSLSSDDFNKYSVSTIPSVNAELSIPLNMECVNRGIYTIAISGSINFGYRYPVFLEDKQLNRFIDLRSDSVYTFSHSPEMNSERFEIHFNSVLPKNIMSELMTIENTYPGELRIYGTQNEVYTANLYSIDGKLINAASGVLSNGIQLNTGNFPSGVCVLQVFNKYQKITKKIITK